VASSEEVEICFLNEELVGLDLTITLQVKFDRPLVVNEAVPAAVTVDGQEIGHGQQRACRHQCSNKLHCAHACCKFGIKNKVLKGLSHQFEFGYKR
jgi:hypothetical protein